jgi:MFS family permease
VTILTYGSLTPFINIGSECIHSINLVISKKYFPGDAQKVGFIMFIPECTAIFGTPLMGLYFDMYGNRALFLSFAGTLLFTGHLILLTATITPFIGMFIMGISYSIFGSAIWTLIPRLVHSHQIATAYGLITGAMNLSLFIFPLIVAYIFRNSPRGDFWYVQLFFMGLSCTAVIFSFILHFLEKNKPTV